MDKYFHSVRLERDKCSGCTNCIKRCPTEAIRVQKGKAKIIDERCIDCGECIRVCPYHAKYALTDNLSSINRFKYKIALPAPALYGQFKALGRIDRVLSGLRLMGFDDVYEVAKGAEIVSRTLIEKLKGKHNMPLISSACPAVVRLVQVRFPELIEHIVDLEAPIEVAAKVAKREYAEKHGVDIKDIGAYFITPCPAKVTAIKAEHDGQRSSVDGAISILEVYGLLAGQLKLDHGADANAEEKEFAGAKGVGWANSGGECRAAGVINSLSVDGIANVIHALEDMENGKFTELDFFEGLACPGGCVGGPLVFESSYVSHTRINTLCDIMSDESTMGEKLDKYVAEGVAVSHREIKPVGVMKLDRDMTIAMQKLQKIENIVEQLPGMDCGSCGSPNCRSLAEDIVRGHASMLDCIFIMREKVRYLAEEMVGLASNESGGIKGYGSENEEE